MCIRYSFKSEWTHFDIAYHSDKLNGFAHQSLCITLEQHHPQCVWFKRIHPLQTTTSCMPRKSIVLRSIQLRLLNRFTFAEFHTIYYMWWLCLRKGLFPSWLFWVSESENASKRDVGRPAHGPQYHGAGNPRRIHNKFSKQAALTEEGRTCDWRTHLVVIWDNDQRTSSAE